MLTMITMRWDPRMGIFGTITPLITRFGGIGGMMILRFKDLPLVPIPPTCLLLGLQIQEK